jgi:hypothetical protein
MSNLNDGRANKGLSNQEQVQGISKSGLRETVEHPRVRSGVQPPKIKNPLYLAMPKKTDLTYFIDGECL